MNKMELLKYGQVLANPALLPNSYYSTLVVVVGCGGTGGRLIPALAQHIVNHNRTIETNPVHKQYLKHPIRLLLIDGDTVEAKNLKRQNFYSFDIGRNKAEVMAKRFSALNGMNIEYYDKYIKDDKDTWLERMGDNIIIFDCTDNVKARKLIEDLTESNVNRRTIISCGNEDTFGQVLVSFAQGQYSKNNRVKEISRCLNALDKAIAEPNMAYKGSFNYLPTLLSLYRDFKDTPTASCTDIVLQDEQSMPINALVAQLAYNVFYNVVAGNKFNYHLVTCNIDNIYDTKFINHPIALRELYVRGLFGDCSPEAEACLAAAKDVGFISNDNNSIYYLSYDKVKAMIDTHGKYAIDFAKVYLEYRYNLSQDQIVYINNAIANLEKKDADL